MKGNGPTKWLKEARRLHRSGDAEGALQRYLWCLKKVPGQPEVLMLAAMAAAQAGHLEQAVDLARRATASRDDAASRITLGRMLLETADLEEALECFRVAAADPATAADARFHAGQVLHRLDCPEEAMAMLEEAVRLRPDHGPGWNQLGVVRAAAGMAEAARDAFERSLQARPGDSGTLANLALACLRLGDHEAAILAAEKATAAAPDSPSALLALALVERGRGRLQEALTAWLRLVDLKPGSPDNWAGLGSVQQAMGDLGDAERAFRRALEMDGAHADARAGLAECFEWNGRYDEGLEIISNAPEGCRGPGLDLVAGRLLRRLGKTESARQTMESAVPEPHRDAPLRRQFAFSLGDVCDELGDVDAAWDWYAEGNRLTPARFDTAAHRCWLERLAKPRVEETVGDLGRGVTFIVGMPRSGTTLVEQILAAHTDVLPGGESPLLGRLVQEFWSDPASPDAVRLIGERYAETAATRRGESAMLTDKMPLNYQFVGIIRAALPAAKVVHCRRDPRDTGLSCFFTDFIDPALGFATRLEWLGEYLAAYRRFMAGWSGELPRDLLLEIDYESLVARPESEIRRLLTFLDLPWQDACIRFHETDRFAGTASHAQVRRPVYRTSVGRWQAYAGPLAPLLDRLDGP